MIEIFFGCRHILNTHTQLLLLLLRSERSRGKGAPNAMKMVITRPAKLIGNKMEEENNACERNENKQILASKISRNNDEHDRWTDASTLDAFLTI